MLESPTNAPLVLKAGESSLGGGKGHHSSSIAIQGGKSRGRSIGAGLSTGEGAQSASDGRYGEKNRPRQKKIEGRGVQICDWGGGR